MIHGLRTWSWRHCRGRLRVKQPESFQKRLLSRAQTKLPKKVGWTFPNYAIFFTRINEKISTPIDHVIVKYKCKRGLCLQGKTILFFNIICTLCQISKSVLKQNLCIIQKCNKKYKIFRFLCTKFFSKSVLKQIQKSNKKYKIFRFFLYNIFFKIIPKLK